MSFEPRRLLSAPELEAIVDRLAAEISSDHGDGVILVGVLKGSVCFLADLARRLEVPCAIDFLALSAYARGATRVQVLKDLDLDLSGLDVVLVEDIVDTGLSARYVLDHLAHHGARRVRICSLLDRPSRRILPLEIDYSGLEAPDDFLVGYGLDLGERFRNLPEILVLSEGGMSGDPGELERELYPRPRPERTTLRSV